MKAKKKLYLIRISLFILINLIFFTVLFSCLQIDDPNGINCNRYGKDSDQDGLSDDCEVTGWKVNVYNGYDYETIEVTSDTLNQDSDGDGIFDCDEYILRTNPNLKDTDGDRISDLYEILKYYSSPTSVDSDMDSNGNRMLWDYYEIFSYKTSPIMEDTDGDGMSDYKEIVELSSTFDPLIADVPRLALDFVSAPVITMRGTLTTGTEEQIGQSLSNESASVTSASKTNEASQSTEHVSEMGHSNTNEYSEGVSIGIEEEISFTGASAKMSVGLDYSWTNSNTMSYSHSDSRVEGSSNSFTDEQSDEMRQAHEYTREQVESNEYQSLNAEVAVLVEITNTSNVAFTIKNLTLNLVTRNRNNPKLFEPVCVLTSASFSDGINSNGITLGPNSKTNPILFEFDDLDYTAGEYFMSHPDQMILKIANYNLLNEVGVNFTHNDTDISAKTTAVTIDYGKITDNDSRPKTESYLVATNLKYNLYNGKYAGETLEDILNKLNISYEIDTIQEVVNGNTTNRQKKIFSSIRGLENVQHTDGNGYAGEWVVSVLRNIQHNTQMTTDELTNINTARIYPSDLVSIVYMEDYDKDKLHKRTEILQGCRDNSVDTDGDGVSDYDEINEGYKITVNNKEVMVFSHPGYEDFDEDGLNDPNEKLRGTDPLHKDTDGDGLDDNTEITGWNVSVYASSSDVGASSLSSENVTSDPTKADTDGDGLNDDKECFGHPVNTGSEIIYLKSNPNSVDTDGDGMNDFDEVEGWKVYTGETSAITLQTDTDTEKHQNGVWSSNPCILDSDNDGANDSDEHSKSSNPERADTDGDTLTDGYEITNDINPVLTDTDGDSDPDNTDPTPDVNVANLFAVRTNLQDLVYSELISDGKFGYCFDIDYEGKNAVVYSKNPNRIFIFKRNPQNNNWEYKQSISMTGTVYHLSISPSYLSIAKEFDKTITVYKYDISEKKYLHQNNDWDITFSGDSVEILNLKNTIDSGIFVSYLIEDSSTDVTSIEKYYEVSNSSGFASTQPWAVPEKNDSYEVSGMGYSNIYYVFDSFYFASSLYYKYKIINNGTQDITIEDPSGNYLFTRADMSYNYNPYGYTPHINYFVISTLGKVEIYHNDTAGNDFELAQTINNVFDQYGADVNISDDGKFIYVGGQAAVYVYKKDDGLNSWSAYAKPTIDYFGDSGDYNHFGNYNKISKANGDYIMISDYYCGDANGNFGVISDTGAVYIYKR